MGGRAVTVNSAVFAVVLGAVGFVVPALADEGAEAWRHAQLYDPGGRATEL